MLARLRRSGGGCRGAELRGDAAPPEPACLAAPGWRGETAASSLARISTAPPGRGLVGPLEPLLADPRVTEVLVSGTAPIRVEIGGRLFESELRFESAGQLRLVVDRLLAESGRRVDDGVPLVDARLRDGSRLHVAIPPVAVGGPHLSIRRPRAEPLRLDGLRRSGSVDGEAAELLVSAVAARRALVVTGGASTGKTTLLAALAALVPPEQRVVVLEDVAELDLAGVSAVRLECRPPGRDGGGEVTLRDLVRASLRMRPDRLVVGEVRGAEAADLVQALTTGHDGSMATVHANSAADAVHRLELMVALGWPGLGPGGVAPWLTAALDLVVHCAREHNGRRIAAEVAAVEASPGGTARVRTLYRRGDRPAQ